MNMTFEEWGKKRKHVPVVFDEGANFSREMRKSTAVKKIEKCKYAQDTGEVAFPAAQCRGHRIICQHEKNRGFVSFTKQCQREKCLFFEAECEC